MSRYTTWHPKAAIHPCHFCPPGLVSLAETPLQKKATGPKKGLLTMGLEDRLGTTGNQFL